MSAEDRHWQELFQELLETPGESAGAAGARPEAPDELNEMLFLTQQLQDLGQRQMPDADAALARARERVLQSIPAAVPDRGFALPPIQPPFWQRWRLALEAAMEWSPTPLIAALTIALVLGLMIFAADNARPGSPFYRVKIVADEMMQRLTPSEPDGGQTIIVQIVQESPTVQSPGQAHEQNTDVTPAVKASPVQQPTMMTQTPVNAVPVGPSSGGGEQQPPPQKEIATSVSTPVQSPTRRVVTPGARATQVVVTVAPATVVAKNDVTPAPTSPAINIATGGMAPLTVTAVPSAIMTATVKSPVIGVAGAAVISRTVTPVLTATMAVTDSPALTNTPLPVTTATPSPEATSMPAATNSPTVAPTHTPTVTSSPGVFATVTSVATRKPSRTVAPTATPKPTHKPSVEPELTATATPRPVVSTVQTQSSSAPVARTATPTATVKLKSAFGVIYRVRRKNGKVVGFYINRRYIRITKTTVVQGEIVAGGKAAVSYYTKKKRHYAASVVVTGAARSGAGREYQTLAGAIGRVRKVRGRIVGFYLNGRYIRMTKNTTVKGKIVSRKKAIVKYYTKKRRRYAVEVVVQGASKSKPAGKSPTPKPRATKPAVKPSRTPKPTAKPKPVSTPVRRSTATPAG